MSGFIGIFLSSERQRVVNLKFFFVDHAEFGEFAIEDVIGLVMQMFGLFYFIFLTNILIELRLVLLEAFQVILSHFIGLLMFFLDVVLVGLFALLRLFEQ